MCAFDLLGSVAMYAGRPQHRLAPRPGRFRFVSLEFAQAFGSQNFWALMVCLKPAWAHIGFPCTFWVAIAHWTRIRDLDANEQLRLEALAFIVFARQCVHYQSSRGRHASLENPLGSQAWNLDVVQDMMSSSGMGCVQTELCAWVSKNPWSGTYY